MKNYTYFQKHPANRTAVLVDVENGTQNPIPTVPEVQYLQTLLSDVIKDETAEYIVATGTRSYQDTAFAWRGGRVWCRGGPHGAELELLERAGDEKICDRFANVYVVSGDHLFTEYVSELGARGVNTTVVGWRGSVAASLRLATNDVIYLDDLLTPVTTAIEGRQVA